jgi:hypothetical protein
MRLCSAHCAWQWSSVFTRPDVPTHENTPSATSHFCHQSTGDGITLPIPEYKYSLTMHLCSFRKVLLPQVRFTFATPRAQIYRKFIANASFDSAAPRGPAAAVNRREALLAAATIPLMCSEFPAEASTDVGSYLPKAGVDDFVLFVPDKAKTPAIRAGTVSAERPYRFALPPSWSERKVANIASGNYCQPRCAEPWTEVIFADDTEGKAQVLAKLHA